MHINSIHITKTNHVAIPEINRVRTHHAPRAAGTGGVGTDQHIGTLTSCTPLDQVKFVYSKKEMGL